MVSNPTNFFECHRRDDEKYISMYQQHNADLVQLMKKNRAIDMEEPDELGPLPTPKLKTRFKATVRMKRKLRTHV